MNKKNALKFSKIDEKRVEFFSEIVNVLLTAADSLGKVLMTSDVNELCFQTTLTRIIHVNNQGLIQKINNSACAMLKTRPEKIIGANINEAFETYPEVLHDFNNFLVSKNTKSETVVNINNESVGVQYILVTGIEETPSYLIFLDHL